MSAEQDLINKLIISKKIMERHDTMGRNGMNNPAAFSSPEVEEFQPVKANYNLPQDLLSEESIPKTYNTEVPTVDRIANSKLPDEIKRLMMEHPIGQPQQPPTTMSNDLIERATRLMNVNKEGYVPESAKPKQTSVATPQQSNGIDYKLIKKMINEAVNEALHENGLITESSEKSNEVFSFKVGKHIFEGKVTKIKKLS